MLLLRAFLLRAFLLRAFLLRAFLFRDFLLRALLPILATTMGPPCQPSDLQVQATHKRLRVE